MINFLKEEARRASDMTERAIAVAEKLAQEKNQKIFSPWCVKQMTDMSFASRKQTKRLANKMCERSSFRERHLKLAFVTAI